MLVIPISSIVMAVCDFGKPMRGDHKNFKAIEAGKPELSSSIARTLGEVSRIQG
jgi:hypothetical protein